MAYAFRVQSPTRRFQRQDLRAAALRPAAEARCPPIENHASLLQELQVRQLELEVQNEALQQGYAELESAKADIEAGLKRYAALYELAPLAYFTLSPEGGVLKTNRMGQARLGQPIPEMGLQRFAAVLEETSLSTFELFLHQIFDAETQEPEPRKVCELRLRPQADKAGATVEVTGMALAGQVNCNVAMVDVTERIEARQEIERLNDALEMRVNQLGQANDDLEAFSSAVAHDLQTPLTAMDGFRLMLERALREGEPAQARHCASRIGTLIAQMGQTTSGLLSLAHISRGPLHWADCDLTRMSLDILQSLREHAPTRNVQAEVQPGLHAFGDPALLRLLLTNLLGNAWKFTSAQPMARIRLARDDSPTGPSRQHGFVVEDNGAGFDMAHADRLFGAFERLHSPSEFPGSGIGLATVKRIVTRHGGRISAWGSPGQGARFRFSLPTQAEPTLA